MIVDRVLRDLDTPDTDERGRGHSSRGYMRAWKAANAERVRSYMTDYRRRRAAEVNRSNQEWRLRNPATVAASKRGERQRNRSRIYADNAMRRSKRLAVTVEPVDLDAVLIRFAGRCGICRAPVPPHDLHFDHIVPLARGGTHSTDNLQPAHRLCNLRKGARCS